MRLTPNPPPEAKAIMPFPAPKPENHPIVQTLQVLTSPKAPLPGWPEALEHSELAREYRLDDPEAVKQYVSFLTEALAQAEAAAAMRPTDQWLRARQALRDAETKAATAWRQTFSFADQDQEFLRAQWSSAQRSLRALQDRIDAEIRGSSTGHGSGPADGPPPTLAEAFALIRRLPPFDRAALTRTLIATEVIEKMPDLPENVGSEFYEAATTLLFSAIHPEESND